jgi:hypothetical protein
MYLLERRVLRMEDLLDKIEATPVADVIQDKEETAKDGTTVRTKTIVKGLKLAGYARSIQVRNETARQAVTGVKTKAIEPEDAPAVHDEFSRRLAELGIAPRVQ